MRAPLSWIRDFTPVDASVADIVSALNQLGLEVEGVDQPGEEITGVIAAQVLNVEAHPNADKLSLVDVTTGAGLTRVVCGAPNVVAGMVVPYAPSGATMKIGGFIFSIVRICTGDVCVRNRICSGSPSST
jgi:phenylalanyl-tRNA synthetase beta chain